MQTGCRQVSFDCAYLFIYLTDLYLNPLKQQNFPNVKRFIRYPQSGQDVAAVPDLEARGQCRSLYPPLDLHTPLDPGQKGGDTKLRE